MKKEIKKQYVVEALINGEFQAVFTAQRVDIAKKRLNKAEGMLQTRCRIVDVTSGLKIEVRKSTVYSV